MKDILTETTGNTLRELWRSQDFLYRNFFNYERYKDMKTDNNQLDFLCGSEKIKFKNIKLVKFVVSSD